MPDASIQRDAANTELTYALPLVYVSADASRSEFSFVSELVVTLFAQYESKAHSIIGVCKIFSNIVGKYF